jgi:hypothetical protein
VNCSEGRIVVIFNQNPALECWGVEAVRPIRRDIAGEDIIFDGDDC